MRKAILIAFLLIFTACSKDKENNVPIEKNFKVNEIQNSDKLEFTKWTDKLEYDEIENFSDYFEVVDENLNKVPVEKRWLDKNLLEVYATDSDGIELRTAVRIINSSDNTNKDVDFIENPEPRKEYR